MHRVGQKKVMKTVNIFKKPYLLEQGVGIKKDIGSENVGGGMSTFHMLVAQTNVDVPQANPE